MSAVRPCPAVSTTPAAEAMSRSSCFARWTMLMPIGWLEWASAAAVSARSSLSLMPFAGVTDCTTKLPSVIVPVLSKTTFFTVSIDSSASPPLKRMPSFDPAPMPEK